jgi:hypothetical protein
MSVNTTNPNEFGSKGELKGDWPPAPPGTTKGNGSDPPAWQKTAVIAATAAAVGLLGVIIAKKRSGKSDDEIKDDLKRSGREATSAAKKAARKGSEVAQEKGADLWGFTKAKAQETKEDFPGTTKKLVDDIKTAGWEGGKDLKRGAAAVAGKAQAAFEDEVEPNYGILGWRHLPGFSPKMGKKGN